MSKFTDIDPLVRENIRNLTPYRSARDEQKEGLLLDANENSLGAPIRNDLELHRYPSPGQEELRKKIAGFRNVVTENVFTGVGSDEAIDLLIRIFCEPARDEILITPPTYGMYSVSAAVNNVGVRQVPLDENFQPDADRILKSADEKTRILFLCSPNNPTGNLLKRVEVMKLIELFPGIVVVDEAYIDFSGQESLTAVVPQYSNLVVLQTFSKAFGLAGIRLGSAISSPQIISYMMKVKAPYNLNKLTARAALDAFKEIDLVKFNIETICQERDYLIEQLEQAPTVEKVYPSDANYILFKIRNAESICRQLADRGIIVRYRGDLPGSEESIRVTVGMPDENVRFLKTLKEILS